VVVARGRDAFSNTHATLGVDVFSDTPHTDLLPAPRRGEVLESL